MLNFANDIRCNRRMTYDIFFQVLHSYAILFTNKFLLISVAHKMSQSSYKFIPDLSNDFTTKNSYSWN